jgi:hypothetical protein
LKRIPQIAKDNKTKERRDCGSRKYLQNTAVFQRIKKLIKIKHHLRERLTRGIPARRHGSARVLTRLAIRYFGGGGRLNTFTIHQQLELPEARS